MILGQSPSFSGPEFPRELVKEPYFPLFCPTSKHSMGSITHAEIIRLIAKDEPIGQRFQSPLGEAIFSYWSFSQMSSANQQKII